MAEDEENGAECRQEYSFIVVWMSLKETNERVREREDLETRDWIMTQSMGKRLGLFKDIFGLVWFSFLKWFKSMLLP
jgi:hypothetical protein